MIEFADQQSTINRIARSLCESSNPLCWCVVLPPGFANEYAIAEDGTLNILLKNNVGKDITLSNINCDGTDVPDTTAIADGASATVTASVCAPAGTAGACYSVPIVITYATSAGIDLKSAGTLNGKY